MRILMYYHKCVLKSERWKSQGAQAKEGIHHGTQLSATAAEWASEYYIYKVHNVSKLLTNQGYLNSSKFGICCYCMFLFEYAVLE